MNWKSHPTQKTTRSRRARKAGRSEAFWHNKGLRAKINREKRATRVS